MRVPPRQPVFRATEGRANVFPALPCPGPDLIKSLEVFADSGTCPCCRAATGGLVPCNVIAAALQSPQEAHARGESACLVARVLKPVDTLPKRLAGVWSGHDRIEG